MGPGARGRQRRSRYQGVPLGAGALLVALLWIPIGCSSSEDCSAQTPCPSGKLCISGSCEAPPDLEQACTGGCATGQSCQTGEDFPTGACTITCGGMQACPTASSCVTLASGNYCLKDCGTASDCPQGYQCELFTGASVPVCVSPRANTPPSSSCSASPNLVSGGLVGPATEPSGCQRPVVGSALPSGQVQHLGQHAVGTQLSFDVPAGSASVSIVSQEVSAADSIVFSGTQLNNSVVPGLILLPDGTTLYSDWDTPPENLTLASQVYEGLTPNTGALTYPNTSPGLATVASSGAPAGTWSVVVNDFSYECTASPGSCSGGDDGGIYDITVLTKPGPLPTQGTLDVAIYLVTETALTSATAPGDPSIQRFVQSLAKFYGDAGICLGTVTFFDLPAWAKTKYASSINVDQDGPCEDLHQMFTLSQPGNTLNLFFVDALTTSDNVGGTLVGLDGAIPGASSLGGTPASGAAVTMADLTSGSCAGAVDPLRCGADEVAFISAHEGGHWLGLYHSTESHGTHFDPLVDTPSCVCDLCASASDVSRCADKGGNPDGGPAFVDGERCLQPTVACGGGENLMFWELNTQSTGALTHEQAEVMLANPLIH